MHAAIRLPPPLRRLRLAVLPLAWIAAAASAAAGQEPSPPGLTLEEVVRTTLSASAAVHTAEAGVRRQAGVVRQAQGAFDPRLSTVLSAQRVEDPAEAGAGATGTSRRGMEYGVGLDRRLRSGVVLSPQVAVSRAEVLGSDLLPRNLATASLDVLVPLGRGRGGGLATAQDLAARGAHAAATAELRHRRAESVLRSVEAYWGYVAAVRKLEVLRQAEARAGRLVEETRRMVEADQLPAADLVRVTASLASRRAGRIAGEQGLTAARQALGLAMGIPAESLSTLPLPATPFPVPGEAAAAIPPAEALAAGALRARADLAAVRSRHEAARTLLRGARSELRPQVDVGFSLGYTGVEEGGALNRMLAPVSGRSGFHAGVKLSTGLALGNRAAEGLALQSAADEQDAAGAERELVRRIALEAEAAAETLRRSAEELGQTAEAVRLHSATVENERRRFQLGGATLFDALYAEDGLTAATLAHIDGELRHAAALARLRFAAGSPAPEAPAAPRD